MNFTILFEVALRLAAPVLLVAMGGILAQQVNIFNLGLEGFMLTGAFASVVGAYYSNNTYVGVLVGVLVSVLLILLYAIFIIELKVDPTICAIAIITMTGGLTRFLLKPIFNTSGRYVLDTDLALPIYEIPLLRNIPFIGEILSGHSILVYLALISPFLLRFVLYKTNTGLSLRSVGYNSEAALAAGINVNKYKYGALIVNGIFCGLGGSLLSLSLNMFNVGMTDGRGFTALAAITLSGGRPIIAVLVCLLFGISESLVVALSGEGFSTYLLGMIPYVLALIAAVLPQLVHKSVNHRKRTIAQKHSMVQNINKY